MPIAATQDTLFDPPERMMCPEEPEDLGSSYVSETELRQRGLERIAERTGGIALSREQLIDRIHTINPTAGISYLESFDTATLLTYLERLLRQTEPRSAGSTWVRQPGEPAITMYAA